MLEYKLNANNLGTDRYQIGFNGVECVDHDTLYGDDMEVTILCDSEPTAKVGDTLEVVSRYQYINNSGEVPTMETLTETTYVTVYQTDITAQTITCVESKYQTIRCTTLSKYFNYSVDASSPEYGRMYIDFTFDRCHMYEDVDTGMKLYVVYGNGNYVYIDSGIRVIDYNILRVSYDTTIDGFDDFLDKVFTGSTNTIDTPSFVKVNRPQYRFGDYTGDIVLKPLIYGYRYNIQVNVPIVQKNDVRLMHNENLNEYFVEKEIDNAINKPVELEKHKYTPITHQKDDYVKFIERINFNIHMREHTGEFWTVEPDDGWTFSNHRNLYGDEFYSYSNQTNQSDLLTYLDFNNADVKYQKNKLKKTFLRLSFYDSTNPANQNLVAYSTVFFDTNKLFAKYVRNGENAIYKDTDGDDLKGIQVNGEVTDTTIKGTSDENIEEYRLSSQFSVMNPYMGHNSSEGYYLYLWADSKTESVPGTLYMKVELNHAKYGRVIPMMCPYKDGKMGFKTIRDIINDWDNDGYGIKEYLKYSYITWRYEYNTKDNRYYYYLDPETYGDMSTNATTLNINLYEAKINYSK